MSNEVGSQSSISAAQAGAPLIQGADDGTRGASSPVPPAGSSLMRSTNNLQRTLFLILLSIIAVGLVVLAGVCVSGGCSSGPSKATVEPLPSLSASAAYATTKDPTNSPLDIPVQTNTPTRPPTSTTAQPPTNAPKLPPSASPVQNLTNSTAGLPPGQLYDPNAPITGGPPTLPSLPVVPSVPCPQDAACSFITTALDPVFPPKTRALLNIPGSCQNWALEWLRTGNDIMEFEVDRIRQRFTMALLYCEFDGDTWLDGELWLSDLHECDWYNMIGVDPCSRTEEYQIIHIDGQQIRGTLPPELSMMSTLWEITLSGNLLSGTIPEEFSKLAQLNTISLSSNLFEGTIPDLIWTYEDMTYLDLANNFFTGTLPETVHMTEPNLKVLFVENNNLSGSIPSTFGSLNWHRLHLDGNDLSGPIPQDINSAQLEELLLHDNKLTGTFPAGSFANDFGGKSKLREVTLYGNELIGDLDEMCNLVYDGNLTVFEVDIDEVKCECCQGAPL